MDNSITITQLDSKAFGFGICVICEEWKKDNFVLYCVHIRNTIFDLTTNNHKYSDSYIDFVDNIDEAYKKYASIIGFISKYNVDKGETAESKAMDYYDDSDYYEDTYGPNDDVNPMAAEFTKRYIESRVHIISIERSHIRDIEYACTLQIDDHKYDIFIDADYEIYYNPEYFCIKAPKFDELIETTFGITEDKFLRNCIRRIIIKNIREAIRKMSGEDNDE